ncbi:hypothetical protein ACWERY_15970 [Streptomyces sp. NPDC004082]
MNADQRAEYIVQCVRESGSMYEDDARQFLAEHDAHVRAEVLDEQGPGDQETLGEAAQMYRMLRDAIVATMPDPNEWDGDGDEGSILANYVVWLAKQHQEQASAPAPTGAPDFLQVGRTYRSPHSGYTAPELITTFRVEHVTRHPDRGHLRAIGWARTGEPGAGWHGDFLDEQDIDGWTEVTEGEAPGA